MATYCVRIKLTTRGKRNPETSSTYEVHSGDGRVVKAGGPISDDPKGVWAKVDAGGAVQNDAKALGLVLNDADIRWEITSVREDARGRPY